MLHWNDFENVEQTDAHTSIVQIVMNGCIWRKNSNFWNPTKDKSIGHENTILAVCWPLIIMINMIVSSIWIRIWIGFSLIVIWRTKFWNRYSMRFANGQSIWKSVQSKSSRFQNDRISYSTYWTHTHMRFVCTRLSWLARSAFRCVLQSFTITILFLFFLFFKQWTWALSTELRLPLKMNGIKKCRLTGKTAEARKRRIVQRPYTLKYTIPVRKEAKEVGHHIYSEVQGNFNFRYKIVFEVKRYTQFVFVECSIFAFEICVYRNCCAC